MAAGARRRLRTACATQEPAAMYRALLAWLADHYGTSQHQAANAFRQAGHGDLLDRLAAAAYRPGSAQAPVSGREVLDSVRGLGGLGLLSRRLRGHRRPPSEPLPALYD
jgi:hypothetical protein